MSGNDDRRQRGLEEGAVKKIVSVTIIGAIVIAILITFIFNRGEPSLPEDIENDTPPKKEDLIDDDRDKLYKNKGEEEEVEVAPAEDTVEGRAAKNRKVALDNLEKTNEPIDDLSEEEMAVLNGDMQELITFLSQDYSGFADGVGNYFSSVGFSESIAGQTESYMGEQINIALTLVGYNLAPETAEWFYSKTDDVYQFAVSLKAEGRDDLIISGNYNKDLRVFRIFKLHGTLDLNEFAS